MERIRWFVLAIALVLACTPLLAQSSGLTLIRNNSITGLQPTTPPMASLFDQNTGQLLGTEIPQTYQYVSYGEDLRVQGDGPLVMYQLSDPNQTLFLSRTADTVFLGSYDGRCTRVDDNEISRVIYNVPNLQVELDRARTLFGVLAYPGGIVCEDANGILSAATLPVQVTGARAVSLVFHRAALEVPTSYVVVAHANSLDFLNITGGLRYDRTDPNNPFYVTLDPSGNPAPAMSRLTTESCEDVGRAYHACLVTDPDWLQLADAVADHMTSLRTAGTTIGTCLTVLVSYSKSAIATCALKGTVTFTALIASGTGHLFHTNCHSVLPSGGSVCPPPDDAAPECSFQGTCNLNGGDGFAYCTYPTTGPNTCGNSGSSCGAAPHCESDLCTTSPNAAAGTPCTSDANPCTRDECDGVGGCPHPAGNMGATCRSAVSACDTAETCTGLSVECPPDAQMPNGTPCGSSGTTPCDNPDTCDEQGNCRANHHPQGTECGDLTNHCTISGACNSDGACVLIPVDCNDSNPCTDDACNQQSGCVYSQHVCISDNNFCTQEVCTPPGGCEYIPINCNDHNECTTDFCNPASGCVSSSPCDDQDRCTDDICVNPSLGTCEHSQNSNVLCSIGCADGSREGFADMSEHPSIAVCGGGWTGPIWRPHQFPGASGNNLCYDEWDVCSPEDWSSHAATLAAVTYDDAIAIEGCFPYNASNDSGGCARCGIGHMAALGADCTNGYYSSTESACIANGRIDAGLSNSCRQNTVAPYTGVVCCRTPVRLESLILPVNGNTVTSSTVLASGVSYLIRSSGTFIIASGNTLADAEYALIAGGEIRNRCGGDPDGLDLGVAINETSGNEKFPFWGAYNTSHVYEISYVGQGQPIAFHYFDCGYSDNSGSLVIDIFRP